MKIQKLLFVLLICFLPTWVMRAADPATITRHWYTVVFTNGTNVDTFTGSSPLGAENLSQGVTAEASPVRLENIRVMDRRNDKSGWYENKTITTVFIMPRNIVYFYELTEEPKLIE